MTHDLDPRARARFGSSTDTPQAARPAALRRLLALALLLAAPPNAAPAQDSPATPAASAGPAITASAIVRSLSPTADRAPSADDLRLYVDGLQAPIVAVDSLRDAADESSLWDIVIFADAELSTAEGLDRSAELIAGQADRLTDLGTVRIVLADPETETLLAPTRDASAVAQTLRRLAGETVGTDRIPAARKRASSTLNAIAGQEEAAARSAIRREQGLIERRQRTLLDWIAIAPGERPRVLLWIADPPRPGALEFFGRQAGAAALADDPGLTRANENLAFAQTLATEGWLVFPVDTVEAGGDRSSAGLSLAADATGGATIGAVDGLTAALESLARAARIRFTPTAPAVTPVPFEIRTRAPGVRLAHPAWLATTTPRAVSAARARRTLATESASGPMAVSAAVVMAEPPIDPNSDPLEPEAPSVSLESLVRFPGRSAGPAASRFRITVVSRRLDEDPVVEHHEVLGGDLSHTSGWVDRRSFTFDDDLQEVAVVIEELSTGLWGGDLAFFSEEPLRIPNMNVATSPPGGPPPSRSASPAASPVDPPPAPAATAGTVVSPPAADRGSPEPDEAGVVIRLLPPRKTSLTGKTKFRTLTTSPRIDRVVFSLDGVETSVDDDPPFAATLDLGSPARPHEISAAALSASGRRLAGDSITVNQTGALFTVDITRVTADAASGTYSVAADITVPPADRLDRVEFYWNESLQQAVAQPPWEATFAAPAATASDYLRVVAHLAGGDSLEDVRLLAQGPVEEVDVNLVELYVVATDPNGVPVKDLEQADFTIRQRNQVREIERFDPATDVPLVMGLVIDTSGSMWALMQETKMAAAQFLGNSLTEGDRAFLVDFSTRPRLAHPQTGDLLALVRAFSTLQPAGYTALYDSIVFTMLQFEEGPGRKAIVLLTDGEDVSSRFGPKRCVEYGRRLGVPVYIVALGLPGQSLRKPVRNDLEGLTEKTGGRVFYISSMSELPAAYEQINAELRSQYLLAFGTEDPLGLDELQELSVTVADPSLATRTVVGGQQIY